MTISNFDQFIKRKVGSDRYWHAGTYIFIIMIGLGLLIFPFIFPEKFSKIDFFFRYAVPTVMLFFGSLLLYRLREEYKIVTITNKRSVQEKEAAIKKLMTEMNAVAIPYMSPYLQFRYSKGFLSNSYDIYFSSDQFSLSFAALKCSADHGIIRSHGTSKLRERLFQNLQTALS